MNILDNLLSRASYKLLTAPGPSTEDLDLIMQAAMRAPDHGALRPWRFKILQGDALRNFTQLAVQMRQLSERPMTEQKAAAVTAWLQEVPTLILVACKLDSQHNHISEQERVLATGCAVMNILNAAHILGYGAFWSTGVATYIDEFQSSIGFDALEYRYLGMVALGTPRGKVVSKDRPDWRSFLL